MFGFLSRGQRLATTAASLKYEGFDKKSYVARWIDSTEVG